MIFQSETLPNTWIVTRISNVAHIIMGQAPPGRSYNKRQEGIPLIAGASDLGVEFPAPSQWTTAPTTLCSEGDMIYCIRATIGEMNWADQEYCLGRGVAAIRADENLVDRYFLFYWLLRHKNNFIKEGTGTTFLQIRRQDLENAQIFLPTLPEQREIVKMLREVDRLRQLRTEANKNSNLLSEAIFYDLFLRNSGQLKSWGYVKLGDISSTITSGPRGWAKYYSNSGARFIRVQDVLHGRLADSDFAYVNPPIGSDADRARIFANDLLITITGTTGRVAIAPADIGEAYVSQHVALVRLNEALSRDYVSSYLNHALGGQIQIQELNYGQTRAGLNLGQLETLRIPHPPANLIEKFDKRLRENWLMQEYIRQSTKEFEDLVASLLARAFSGELTERYREENQAYLAEMAEQRDELLQEPASITTDESPVQIRATNTLRNELSSSQLAIVDTVEQDNEYRTLQSIQAESNLPPNEIQRHLELLTQIGLIKAVGVPVAPGERNRVFFTTAYRAIREEDDVREADLAILDAMLNDEQMIRG